jgi:hypothetical protein
MAGIGRLATATTASNADDIANSVTDVTELRDATLPDLQANMTEHEEGDAEEKKVSDAHRLFCCIFVCFMHANATELIDTAAASDALMCDTSSMKCGARIVNTFGVDLYSTGTV